MKMVSLSVLTFALLAVLRANAAPTSDQVTWTFTCPTNQVLNHVRSVFRGSPKYDRDWEFGCMEAPHDSRTEHCEWSNYRNSFYGTAGFRCGNNKVITGIMTKYLSQDKDRQFSFQCCTVLGLKPTRCSISPVRNNYQHELDFMLPNVFGEQVLIGMNSHHNSDFGDRVFRFEYCDVINDFD